jgi:hypothetical protein
MKSILTSTALATALVFGLAAAGPGVVRSQDTQDTQMNSKECVGEYCPGKKKMKAPEQKGQMKNDTELNAQTNTEVGTYKKKKKIGAQTDTDVKVQTGEETIIKKKQRVGVQQSDVNVDVETGVESGRTWHFDPSREQRRRTRSATFRFFYLGWYYPQPYWLIVGPGRISCGEGRAIVAQRFDRVRVVECRGGIYTYLGRRYGDTFRVMVNSRSGRIVGRAMIYG